MEKIMTMRINQKLLLMPLLLLVSYSIQAQVPKIEDYKAIFHVGKVVMVCGNVNEVKKLKKQTYLNLGDSYPKQKLSILIWDEDLSRLNAKFGSLSSLNNNRVCARGKIIDYKGRLEIVVKKADNLRLMK